MVVSNHRSHSIPTNPPLLLPIRKALPQLGTQEPYIFSMDVFHIETSDEFDQQERCIILERGEVGVGDRYLNTQPNSAQGTDKGFIGKRLYICLQYFLCDSGTYIQ